MKPVPLPRSALLLRPDGMGDLVLFQPVLQALQTAWPHTQWHVLVRDAYVGLGQILAPHASWWGTSLDPQRNGPESDGTELQSLLDRIGVLDPELLVGCTARRTWLESAAAPAAPRARKVAFCTPGEDLFFGPQARTLFGMPASAGWQLAPARDGDQDWHRNFGISDLLTGSAEPNPPRLPDGPWRQAANALLETWCMRSGGYAVCAPAGFAHVAIKTWPAERFAAVLEQTCAPASLPAVLVGHHSERSYLEKLAGSCGARVWTGGGDDWTVMASLLAQARVCLGNDTGALHLAAAVGTPVVGVFGGGTWPRFIPAGPGIAVLNPLPCFGCEWDCAFGHAPCVQAVSVDDVVQAFRRVVSERLAKCEVIATRHLSSETASIMGAAGVRYRERALLLHARERQFQETVQLAGGKDGEIASLKTETDQKDREIDSLKRETDHKDAEIGALKRATDVKDVEIGMLKAATDEKDREIQQLKASTVERLVMIDSLSKAAAELQASGRDKELIIRDLKVAADMRLREIEKLTQACQHLQQAASGGTPG